MKRTGLNRRAGLSRGSSSELKRSGGLKPLSAKARARRQEDSERVQREGAAFHAAIQGERCVVCGRTAQEALEAGTRHHAHHGVRKEVLKRLGLRELLWDPKNAVCLCEQPCHAEHTSRKRRIQVDRLPDRVWAFAKQHGLLEQLQTEYDGSGLP